VAAAAWVYVVLQAGSGMGGPATGLLPFTFAWAVMMAAMMLPTAAPAAALYVRSVAGSRLRLGAFTAGYLGVWAATALPAYLVVNLGSEVAMKFGVGRLLAAAAFLLVAAYQLSPLKAHCLARCRSPLSLFLEYAGYHGAVRDLRAGAHNGAYCLGCCWPLMLLLPVVGMMNLLVVVVLATFVVAEKNFAHDQTLSRLGAATAAALAVAALFLPQLGFALVSM